MWPWIYGNPWRFNQGGVNPNCARWVADYPEVASPTWSQAQDWICPAAEGNVVAWQFCSDGFANGISGKVCLDLFYGNKANWESYANPKKAEYQSSVLENNKYVVTVREK